MGEESRYLRIGGQDVSVLKEDFGKYLIYTIEGVSGYGAPAVIFYKTDPSSEALTLLEVSNSSRINPREDETLLERIKKKSNLLLGNYNETEARKTLNDIIYTLGSNNIKEQAHILVAVLAPIQSVMKIQDESLGFASQERSTRYVPFREFYTPRRMDEEREAKEIYTNALLKLHEAYDSLLNILVAELSEEHMRKTGNPPTEKESKEVIIPSARDLCRGFTPLAAQTVVYISANAKNVENIVGRLMSTGSETDKTIGALIATAMQDNAPSLSRHMEASEFSRELYGATWSFEETSSFKDTIRPFSSLRTTIGDGSSTEEQLQAEIRNMGVDTAKLEGLMRARGGKFDALNRTALGVGSLIVQFEISLGSMRDLMRHRDAIKSYSIGNGFVLPDALMTGSKFEVAREALAYVNDARKKIVALGFSDEATLLLPLATESRLNMEMGLGEALYMVENRSTREAHPEYKHLALELLDALRERYPRLLKSVKLFADGTETPFSRVEREKAKETNKVLG